MADLSTYETPYELNFIVSSTSLPSVSESVTIPFSKSWSSCTKIFQSQSKPYSFDNIKYVLGSGQANYEFIGFDLNDCPFETRLNFRKSDEASFSSASTVEKFQMPSTQFRYDENDSRLV